MQQNNLYKLANNYERLTRKLAYDLSWIEDTSKVESHASNYVTILALDEKEKSLDLVISGNFPEEEKERARQAKQIIETTKSNLRQVELEKPKPQTNYQYSLGDGGVVLQRAIADLGTTEDEGENLGHHIRDYFNAVNYHLGNKGAPWCAAAVSYWIRGAAPVSGSASVPALMEQFKSAGKFVPKNSLEERFLAPGNVIFLNGHVGILESVSGDTLNTIEGNSGAKSDSVVRAKRNIKGPSFLGVGVISMLPETNA